MEEFESRLEKSLEFCKQSIMGSSGDGSEDKEPGKLVSKRNGNSYIKKSYLTPPLVHGDERLVLCLSPGPWRKLKLEGWPSLSD